MGTLPNHIWVSWGSACGSHTNKSAEIDLLLNKKVFNSKSIINVFSPPASVQGRGGALRLQGSDYDVLYLGLYVPPFAGPAIARGAFMKGLKILLGWADNTIKSVPSRCMPIVAMGSNLKVGKRDGERLESKVCGDFFIGENCTAGDAMYELALVHRLAFVNTYYNTGASYFGPTPVRLLAQTT